MPRTETPLGVGLRYLRPRGFPLALHCMTARSQVNRDRLTSMSTPKWIIDFDLLEFFGPRITGEGPHRRV